MNQLLKISLLLLLFLGTNDVFGQAQTSEFNKAFTHVVYFWLNNPDSPDDRRDFEASITKFMKESEYAGTRFIGIPAGTPREVVDNSYSYSLILTFPSREAQDQYQKEPAHLKFIEEASHLWEKVQVYDSVGIVD